MSGGQHRGVVAAQGKKFAIVSGHALATDAALQILNDGGNPVDAAIAGAVVLTVVLPHACTLGGDCFALIHESGKTYGINGSGPSPFGLPSDVKAGALARGPLSCSVPGMLGAWWALHKRFGSRDWPALLKVGINRARDGISASSDFARASRANLESLRQDAGCRELFLRDGEPIEEGTPFSQPVLADTLEQIAEEGAPAFYQGHVGRRLCDSVAERGGVLSVDDLQAYEALWVEPLSYAYRGRVVRVMPPNSYGLVMLMQLAALEGENLADYPLESVERLAILMKAARAAFREGAPFVVDPKLVASRSGEFLHPDRIARLRNALRTSETPPNSAIPGHGTALISVADGLGNATTIVQSIFAPFGSLLADPSTGIVLNNRLLGFSNTPGHPNAPGAHKRPAHTLSPAMVFDDSRLGLLLGTPGGSGQTITLTQVLTAIVDLGLDLPSAIASPRWSMDLKGDFALEPEVGSDMPQQLATHGIEAHVALPDQQFFFGSAECIQFKDDGHLVAVADNRREAHAAAM